MRPSFHSKGTVVVAALWASWARSGRQEVPAVLYRSGGMLSGPGALPVLVDAKALHKILPLLAVWQAFLPEVPGTNRGKAGARESRQCGGKASGREVAEEVLSKLLGPSGGGENSGCLLWKGGERLAWDLWRPSSTWAL